MKKIVLPLFAIAFLLVGCSGPKTVTNNYYDDGIYYDPSKTSEGFTLNDIQEPEPLQNRAQNQTQNPNAGSADDLNYYDPNDNNPENYRNSGSTGGNTVVNNYYGSPTMRYPGVNNNFYWNSWGGWGMGMNVGMGCGFGCYDPFFYDPWFDPYWGYGGWGMGPRWGFGFGFGNPYRPWGYRGWNGGFGYNSYWAGYYHGYYHGNVNAGFGDGFGGGRNVTYVRSANTANRTNSFNSVSGNRVAKKSNGSRGDGRVASDNSNRSRIGVADRGDTKRATVASSRFSDRNMSRTTLSERSTAVDRSVTASANRSTTRRAADRGSYTSDSYNYVRERSSSRSKANEAPVATERIGRTGTATRGSDVRSRTESYSRESYTRQRSSNNASNNNSRSNSRNDNMYVPSETRSRTYDNSSNNRNRTSTPSRANERSNTQQRQRATTPSRSNNSRSYTPSNSRSNNRSSTPSRSGSYNRGGSSSGGGYSPSRSSGGSRSSSPSRGGGGRSRGR